MKKIISLFLLVIILFSACNSETDTIEKSVSVTLKFTHHWDETTINSADFNNFKFTNQNGETISIELLRYLVSNIQIGNFQKKFQLINVGENLGLEIKFDQVQKGNQMLAFRFGFSDADNLDGFYKDLNSVSFNVPMMMGSGYHYMQFDGKYKDNNNQNANFNYHVIRAVDNSNPMNLVLEDTSFEINLGLLEITNNTTIEIRMNIAEWFKNPNTWDLNVLNTVLMPNFNAQKMMNENGKNVFTLGAISTK